MPCSPLSSLPSTFSCPPAAWVNIENWKLSVAKGDVGQVWGTSHCWVRVPREQQLCPGDVCPQLLCPLGTVVLSLKVSWALKTLEAFRGLSHKQLRNGFSTSFQTGCCSQASSEQRGFDLTGRENAEEPDFPGR